MSLLDPRDLLKKLKSHHVIAFLGAVFLFMAFSQYSNKKNRSIR